MDKTVVQSWISELESELDDIIRFWSTRMPDEEKGGFLAGILTSGEVVRSGPKGAVLNARILWSFSALAIHFRDSGSGNDPDDRFETCSRMATRAFGYLIRFFRDPEYAT